MFKHTPESPLLVILTGPLVVACASICKETVVRAVAYVGADYIFARLIKRESKQVRTSIDKFLDD